MATTVLEVQEPYALGWTLFSGQAFRWTADRGMYRGFIANVPVRLARADAGVTAESGSPTTMEDHLRRYLRADDPMREIYRSIGGDPAVAKAVARWRGLHLLAQDPWETTAAFIASTASNIPRIRRTVEALCGRFGERAEAPWGRTRLFPSASRIARAPKPALLECGLGYRAAYLRSTARRVARGDIDLESLRKVPTKRAREILVESLDGVGPKVADCVLLFALGKDDAFPVDRWVQRRVADLYHGGKPMAPAKVAAWGQARWGPWAGYAQQYLFHDARAGRGAPPTAG